MTVIISPTLEKNLQIKLNKFINKLSSSGRYDLTNCLCIRLDSTTEMIKAPCHASLRDKNKNLLLLASGYPFNNATKHIAIRFWNWITDVKKSPWRVITKNKIQLHFDEITGNCKCWSIVDPVLQTIPFLFLKNFCILTRTVAEHPKKFEFWYNLVVNYKIDEAEAFYLCSMFDAQKDSFCSINDYRNGTHWALTEPCQIYDDKNYFDWKRFKNGEINTDVRSRYCSVNSFWFSENNTTAIKPFQIDTRKAKVREGSFSYTPFIAIEDVIYQFNEYKRVMNI